MDFFPLHVHSLVWAPIAKKFNDPSCDFLWQFYDHFFEWDLKEEISKLIMIRTRHRIKRNSSVRILASDSDLYVAAIDGKILSRLGQDLMLGILFLILQKNCYLWKRLLCMGEVAKEQEWFTKVQVGVHRSYTQSVFADIIYEYAASWYYLYAA